VTSKQDHIDVLTAAASRLAAAIQAAATRWQCVPEFETWSPRVAAEHIIPAVVIYIDLIAGELGRPPYDWSRLDASFEDAPAALRNLDNVRTWALDVLQELPEARFEAYMSAMEDWPGFATTLGGAALMVAGHVRQHAAQIEGMLAHPRS
jgi:hypothetical protein